MPLVGAFIVPHPPLIVHEIGKGQEKQILTTIKAYRAIAKKIKDLDPDTIVLSTPHSILYSNYFHISPGWGAEGSFRDFGAPEIQFDIEYDQEFVSRLSDLAKSQGIPAGIMGEKKKGLDHGTMVPLYFILKELSEFKLVRVSLSGLSFLTHYRFGKCITKIADQTDQRIIFVASGDLSHKLKEDGPYGLSPEGPIFDKLVTEAMAKADFLQFLTLEEGFSEAAAECGLRSFLIMAGCLDSKIVRSELLSYEGPFGVGYAVASFEPIGIDLSRNFDQLFEGMETSRFISIRTNEDPFVKLARMSLEYYLKNGKILSCPDKLPKEMTQSKAGVFVSIKKEGSLRGCIGTTQYTTRSVANEIIQNAVSAGLQDPRFEPVHESELPHLIYSVDVLSKSEHISSIKELDVKKYGVIVRFKGKSGLLLPNLEGIDKPKQQVTIALKKAGISEDEPYEMERFEVIRHH